jgi:FtsH-binding integral membrane protein
VGLFGDLLGWLVPGTSGLERVGAVLTAFFGTITDGKMWRSLGWLLLGLLIMGFALLWLSKPALQRLESR